VIRHGIRGKLRRTLESTNPCESMIDSVETTQRNVKHWSSGEMGLRWTAAGMLEAERQFRNWFDIATVALRSDPESLHWADTYVEASTDLERSVLDRVEPPDRQAWPVSHEPRRARVSKAVNRAEKVLRWQAPIPRQRRPGSAEVHTVLYAT
jgi:hypothetical protein